MASGWNLWVWLQCIGVVSGCFVRRYIDILTIIITPLVLALFLAAASLLLCSILKMFFRSCFCYFFKYNVTQRTFEIVQKIEIKQI